MKSYGFIIIPLLLSFSTMAQSGELAAYCNQKFGFCIHYPEALFDKEAVLLNQKGIVLTSERGNIRLEILGIANVNNWTTKDIYYLQFEDTLSRHPSNRLLHSKVEAEFCIVESIIDKQRQYFEVRMRADYYIIIRLKVPEYFSEMDYQHLLSQIGLANAALEEY
jgi:hypothetical protein